MNVPLRIALTSLLFCILMLAATALPAAAATRTVSHEASATYRSAAAAQYAYPQGGSGIIPIRRFC